MKKIFTRFLASALIFCCVILAGCSSPIYGKTYTYQGDVNLAWSTLDPSYGKGIEQIITNQIKANNVDWTQCKFGNQTIDLSSEKFENGKQVVEYFTNKYKEIASEKLKGIEVTIGSEEEMTLTAKQNEEELVYNLKRSSETENLLFGYLVNNGVESEQFSISVFDSLNGNKLRLFGADYETEITISVNNDLLSVNGEYVDIKFSFAACYTKA